MWNDSLLRSKDTCFACPHKCNSRCRDGDKMAKFLTSGSTKQDVLVGVVEGVENLGLDRVEVGEAVELLVLRVLQCAHL